MKKLLSLAVSLAMAAGILSSGAQVLAADSAVMSPQGLVMWPKANWEARPTPISNGSENLVVGDVYDEQTGFYYRNYAGGCMIADGRIAFNANGGVDQTVSEFSYYRWLGGANIDPVTYKVNPLMEYDLSERGITQTNATDFITAKITIGGKLNSNLPTYFEKFTNLKNTELLTDGEYVRKLFIKRIDELAENGNAIGVVYDDTNINVANYGGMISLNLRYSSFNGSITGIADVNKQAIVMNLYCNEGVNVSGEFYQEWNSNYEVYGIPLENARRVTINGVEYTVMEFENSAIVSDPTLPAQTVKINQNNPIAEFELPGTVCGVWKAELEQIINSAPKKQGGIPNDAWDSYSQVLKAAEQIYADDTAAQLQVHEAAIALEQAIGSLPEIVNPESVGITGAPEKMTVGDTAELSAKVLPDEATDKSVTWSSLTPDLASVDSSGNVTALKAGKAAIQVSTANQITAAVDIEIREKQEDVKDPSDVKEPSDENNPSGSDLSVNQPKSIKISGVPEYIKAGGSCKLTVEVLPAGAKADKLSFSSSASSIAKVDSNGKVTAVKAGKAVITVTADNGLTSKVTLIVKSPVTKISFKTRVKKVKRGSKVNLKNLMRVKTPGSKYAIVPKKYKWVSKNKKLVRVNSKGVARVLKKAAKGKKVRIIVKSGNRRLGYITIRVK